MQPTQTKNSLYHPAGQHPNNPQVPNPHPQLRTDTDSRGHRPIKAPPTQTHPRIASKSRTGINTTHDTPTLPAQTANQPTNQPNHPQHKTAHNTNTTPNQQPTHTQPNQLHSPHCQRCPATKASTMSRDTTTPSRASYARIWLGCSTTRTRPNPKGPLFRRFGPCSDCH